MRAVVAACMALLAQTRVAPAQPAARTAAQSHVGKALQMMERQLYSDAAAEFEQALKLTPDDNSVRLEYATCLFAQERDEEARKQFETVRQRLGDRPGLDYYLGRLDLRANDYTAAIKKLEPLESDPKLVKVSLYLGMAYMAVGQQDKALKCLERAARENPHDPEAHYRLARVYSMAGRAADADREYKLYRDSNESQQTGLQDGHDCSEALRTQPIATARMICQRIADPNDARRLILLGRLYAESGAFSDAIEPLQRATALDAESFEAQEYLGLSLFRMRRYQEALAPLRKAVSLNPQYFDTLTLLASALHAVGDDAAALPALERAHALNPDNAQVNSEIAQLRAKFGGKK